MNRICEASKSFWARFATSVLFKPSFDIHSATTLKWVSGSPTRPTFQVRDWPSGAPLIDYKPP